MLEGIPQILEAFDGGDWSAWRFLAEALPELGGNTGFKALAAGRLHELLSVVQARDYGAFT